MPPARTPSLTLGLSFARLSFVRLSFVRLSFVRLSFVRLSFVRLSFVGLLAVVAAVGGCGSTTDDRPAKWSFISATITEPGCATVSCHSPVAQRAGVDLSARDIGYKVLLERHFVIPNNPDLSTVMALMHAQGSIRMPPDVPLPEVDIDLIGRWITAGATND